MTSTNPASITQIVRDWKPPLQASNFIGYIPDPGERDPSGTVLRCLTLNQVPCTQEVAVQNKIMRCSFAVIKIIKRGWVNAPYKRPKASNSKSAPPKFEKELNTKPLFEEFNYYGKDALKVYNYAKANSPSDKGPRVDDCFGILCPGQTLTFSMKSEYVFKENTFPKDMEMIDAYTMVDLIVIPSSVDQAKNGDKGGYGLKLSKVRPHDSSIYSYVKDFPQVLEHSNNAAQRTVLTMLQETLNFGDGFSSPQCDNPTGALNIIPGETIKNCLENKSPLYFLPANQINHLAFITNIRPDLDFFRVQSPEQGMDVAPGVLRIDVPMQQLLRLLNTTDEIYAKTLMDFALAAGAVSFVVTTDEWFNKNETALSTTRGLPVIDVSKLLECVDTAQFNAGAKYVDFPVSFQPPPSIKSLAVSVPMKYTACAGETLFSVPTPDFILVGPGVKLDKAYEVLFVEDDDILLTTFLNAKAGKSPGGTEPGVPTVYQRTCRKRAVDELLAPGEGL